MRKRPVAAAALAAAVAFPAASEAAMFDYFAILDPLSGSGVSGRADLRLDTALNRLDVRIRAKGLAPNQLHIQHIHGAFGPDGKPANSVSPSFARGDDLDGDGFLEAAEGLPAYGPIILNLGDDMGHSGFPTAPDGKISYFQSFDLASTGAFGDNVLTDDPDDRFTAADLLPLGLREIVLHGAFLGEGDGVAPGEADGTAGYVALPVSSGEIAPVPLPATVWLLAAGLGGIGAMRLRRRAAA